MAKRPDGIETVLFTLELLRHIPRTHKVSAAELHEQLSSAGYERDIRTIQRQLKTLSEHFPIELDEKSKPFGYRWAKDAKGLALPVLSEQESLLLQLAEQQLKNQLPDNLMKSLKSLFRQARANLGMEHLSGAKRDKEWLSKVRVISTTLPLIAPDLKPGVFEHVSNALYNNRWLTLDYQSFGGKATTCEVMPLGLAQQGPRLYLVCRYRGFDNERTLAMHRILSAKALTLTFKRPREFDFVTYEADGRFSFGEGRRVRLSFLIEQDMGMILQESPLSADQVAKEVDGKFRITATVVESILLDQWLLAHSPEISKLKRTAE
jgi:predicted DNA-binding transcriptional regulator YafY